MAGAGKDVFLAPTRSYGGLLGLRMFDSCFWAKHTSVAYQRRYDAPSTSSSETSSSNSHPENPVTNEPSLASDTNWVGPDAWSLTSRCAKPMGSSLANKRVDELNVIGLARVLGWGWSGNRASLFRGALLSPVTRPVFFAQFCWQPCLPELLVVSRETYLIGGFHGIGLFLGRLPLPLRRHKAGEGLASWVQFSRCSSTLQRINCCRGGLREDSLFRNSLSCQTRTSGITGQPVFALVPLQRRCRASINPDLRHGFTSA